jgi:hypothetical protein
VETFFFYTFIAVVFLVISGFVLAFIFGLYMGWQAPPPIDFRDESYGQLSLPELKRLSGIEFRQEMTESELEIKLDIEKNFAEAYIDLINSGTGSYEEAMNLPNLQPEVKEALKAHFER